MHGILKKELNTPDRHYSYEHTVQLGRYRFSDNKELDKVDDGAIEAISPETDARISIIPKKKSVRFDDLDDRRVYNEDKHTDNFLKEWIRGIRTAFSWQSLRLLLMDWLFLGILGMGMALTSMFMDNIIEHLQTFQLFLLGKSGQTGNTYLDYICTYLSWLGYTELLVVCSAMLVHYVAPQAIGSGIPEMKTILRGIVLKDFLTLRTLISKVVGLTFSLGSGIPIGKMGPFVHIASIAANLLSNLVANVEGAYGNECRKSEMLAAACATGVACTFSAPVGGVLFSIEVTTMYFSVRNYWRGFFAAACGATVFRLLRVLVLDTEVTLVAFYPTQFPQDAFQPEELPFFALIGLLCGFMGAGFIILYRNIVMFLRQNQLAKKFFQKNWIVYPIVVAFIVATITYPRGFGRFLSGRYKFTRTVLDFFSNCTWSKPLKSPESPHGCTVALLASWTNHEGYGPYNVFLVLFLFTVTFLVLSAVCNTLPIPCGMFMPLFVVGAAFGRLIGEIISTIFPEGIPNNLSNQPIFPGIYAVVGAASLTGAITHSVSVAMICCEITGQLIYIIPLMIAVIIANAVCTYLQPSVYDVMIRIKHLPYLPDLPPSNAAVHLFNAEHIMVSPVRFLCRQCTFADIRNVLVDMPKLRAFPVVDDEASMMLLGSVPRRTLLEVLNVQVGDEARKAEAERRIRSAIDTIDRHFREQQILHDSADRPNVEEDEEIPQESVQQKQKIEGLPPDISHTSSGKISLPTTSIVNEMNDETSLSILTPLRDRYRKTSVNLPLFGVSRKHPRISLMEPRGIMRTKSEERINTRKVGHSAGVTDLQYQQTTSYPQFEIPSVNLPSLSAEQSTISSLTDVKFDLPDDNSTTSEVKPTRKRSRFVVEPVRNSPTTVSSTKNSTKRNVQPGQIQQRPRRNAIFSSFAVANSFESEAAMNSRTNSGASTPTKNSLMDGRAWNYNHQSSITRGINEYVKHAKRRLKQARRKDSSEKVEYDLFGDERCEWEMQRLQESMEFDEKQIDPAPFQLVRRTSVYKVHSLFSLLDLNRAYVTDRGRLVGVVALRDLRIAIQNSQNGLPLKRVETIPCDIESGPSSSPANTAHVEDINDSGKKYENYMANGSANDGSHGEKNRFTFDNIPADTSQVGQIISTSPLPCGKEAAKDDLSPPTRKQSDLFAQLSPNFFARMERERLESSLNTRDINAENDVLTPTLKVVHSSSTSAAYPVLTCIQEENEPISRRSSIKQRHKISSATNLLEMAEIAGGLVRASSPIASLPPASVIHSNSPPTQVLLSMAAFALSSEDADNANMKASTSASQSCELPESLRKESSVVQAVEYLRRKSLALDDLKTLEETPLPDDSIQ